jgi:hypothetical protein
VKVRQITAVAVTGAGDITGAADFHTLSPLRSIITDIEGKAAGKKLAGFYRSEATLAEILSASARTRGT